MKKFGFTLQEILITLAIIGVIAALTIPALTLQYNEKVWAKSLSAAVSNFETAMSTMIIKDGANDLYGTRAWKSLGGGVLSDEGGEIWKFMDIVSETYPLVGEFYAAEFFDNNKDYGYFKGVGNLSNDSREEMYSLPVIGESVVYKTKKGMFLYIYIKDPTKDPDKISEVDAMNAGVSLTETAAKIAFDVNGDKAPNIIGRDIFFFILGADGVLYPYGSKDVNNKLGEEYTCNVWDGTKYGTNNRGMGCTAELIKNGYEMNY